MRFRELHVTCASHMERKWDLNSGCLASVQVPNHCATQPLCVRSILTTPYLLGAPWSRVWEV